jgi:probable rRNA maturation factor
MQKNSVSITNKTKGKLPRLPFARLKQEILGGEFELSIALVTPKESHRLNLTYRQKDKPTNVLSFPLSKNSGELILDIKTASADAKNFDMTPKKFLLFLVIHGMLHLKGFEHGSTMEKQEKKFLEIFS